MAEAAAHGFHNDDPVVSAIDRDHLARMTFGDRRLERELLELFDRQAVILLARMRGTDQAGQLMLAHTLKGSATGIGAQAVADAAHAIESAPSPAARAAAVERLAAAIAAVRPFITALLRESKGIARAAE